MINRILYIWYSRLFILRKRIFSIFRYRIVHLCKSFNVSSLITLHELEARSVSFASLIVKCHHLVCIETFEQYIGDIIDMVLRVLKYVNGMPHLSPTQMGNQMTG